MKLLITLVFFSIFAAGGYAAGTEENSRPAQSIPELQQRLEKLLRDTHTPGMSVAIARRNGPEWVGGLGKADVVNGRAATADTLFRLGSISKGFAALAILKLADEGKLSLEDIR